ncbi:Uncharacterised protein g7457 [Pycnogonum litorale]
MVTATSSDGLNNEIMETFSLYMSQMQRSESNTEILSVNLSNIFILGLTGLGMVGLVSLFGSDIVGHHGRSNVDDEDSRIRFQVKDSPQFGVEDLILMARTSMALISNNSGRNEGSFKSCLWKGICQHKESATKYVRAVEMARDLFFSRYRIHSETIDNYVNDANEVLNTDAEDCKMFKCR